MLTELDPRFGYSFCAPRFRVIPALACGSWPRRSFYFLPAKN
jgi:hypothetical protein